MTIDAACIPRALAQRPQWIVWKVEPREDGGKPTKVPYQARNPDKKASSTGPRTWASIDVALRTYERGGVDGIGYVFSADDPFAGFDLDGCLSDDGTVAPWAKPWLERFDTYVEISPSGHGLKGIVIGKLPGSGVNARGVEVYDQGRYFAITGQRWAGKPSEPREVNGALGDLYAYAQQRKIQMDAEREERRQKAYAQRALENEIDRVRSASEGVRNDQLNRSAFALAGFVSILGEDTINRALTDAAQTAGLGLTEIQQTLRSGFTAGKQQPRRAPPVTPPIESPKPQPTKTKSDYVVNWRSQGVTLRELQTKVFDPERWIVEGILPEGACLMAAKYKSKKSWLALALGIPVAMGGRALGRLEVHPGRVLYLDLEGRQQRIQKRTRAILGVQQVDWPENFHVFTKWPRGDEGMAELGYWFNDYPDTALVVVDVLASFRRPMDKTEMMYQYDRDTVDPINELAEKHRAAILLVHHFNKGKHDDIMDAITGSTGLPSAVNTMWALRRDVNDSAITVMEMRGRDLENDDPLALRWDTYLNMHVIEGPANEVAISAERKIIMELLSDDAPRTPKEIAADLNRSVETVKQLLRKLLNEGLIDKPSYGKYARVARRDHSDHSGIVDHSDHSDHSGAKGKQDTGISGQVLHKSDRDSPRVIPPDHSVLKHQEGPNDKSDQSDRGCKGAWDLSVAEVQKGDEIVWQVWDDITNTMLSEHASQNEAFAEANRRMQS